MRDKTTGFSLRLRAMSPTLGEAPGRMSDHQTSGSGGSRGPAGPGCSLIAVYDYIIVGAGSAGCVLAARLSADPGVSVLLLEAGPPDDADEIRAPAALNRLFQTAYDWNYQTVPQRRAGSRTVYWPRGKVLGGSSSINAMIYIRGNRNDFQSWRDDHGCSGWGYEDLMPYFRRAEDNSRGASSYHGVGGPLTVSDPRSEEHTSELQSHVNLVCRLLL